MKRSEFISLSHKASREITPTKLFAETLADILEKAGLIEPDKKPSKLQEAREAWDKQLWNSYGHIMHDNYESVIKEYQEVLKEAVIAFDGHPYCGGCIKVKNKIKELIED